MSSREILEEGSDDDGLTGAGMDKLVDEGVPHPKHQEELQLSFNCRVSGNKKPSLINWCCAVQ